MTGGFRERVVELRRAVRAMDEDDGFAFNGVNAALRRTFSFEAAVICRQTRHDGRHELEFFHGEGFSTEQQRMYDDSLSRSRILSFDPLRPAAEQRSRVIDVGRTVGFTPAARVLWDRVRLPIDVVRQTRVLVCDGELFLAWVGGFGSRALTCEEVRAFQSLVPSLRSAFAIDRKLRDGALAHAGVAAAMDAIPAATFITSRWGHIAHANAVGRALVERGRAATRTAITDAIAAFEEGRPTSAQVSSLPNGHGTRRWLVVLPDVDGDVALDAKLRTASRDWRLTSRQLDVLGWMARGDANKTIAQRLGCTEATVESHATALFRKAGVDGRTGLVAKLLFGPDRNGAPPTER